MLKFCKPLFLLLFIIFLNNFSFSQILPELEKVKEIKLLEHSRDDVQRILSDYKLSPYDNREYVNVFVTDNAEIEVFYSEGKCEQSEDWNVAEWFVTEISITQKKKLQLKDLSLNFSKFQRENKYINYKLPKLYYNKNSGIIIDSKRNEVEKIVILPSQKDMTKMCDKKLARKLISTSKWLITPMKERVYGGEIIDPTSDVLSLELSSTEINQDSLLKDVNDKNNYSVVVKAKSSDPESDDFLTFNYKISGGKIIGTGGKVLWDLSDVKPGTYTITAAVDDGCGFCGKTMTKTVTVKPCPDCKKP